MPQRLMAIVQLCLAFSLLLWHVMQPFMGEYFALRSQMLLYEYVMGSPTLLKLKPEQEGQLLKQREKFEQLPVKEMILSDYQQLEKYAKRPLMDKVEQGFRGLIQHVPPFEQAWIFFSIVISVMILKKSEGAKHAAWLLLLIVLAYAADNLISGRPRAIQPDERLFPTEEQIIQHYLSAPLSSSPQTQQEQLERGWNRYLIDHWVMNEGEQLDDAKYNFTVARLEALHGQPRSDWLHTYQIKSSLLTLLFYLLWNGLFALIVSRRTLPQPQSSLS